MSQYSFNLNKDDYMIDIGSNLTSNKFKYNVDDVVDRAFKNNVKMQIITGTNCKNSISANILTKKYKFNHILRHTIGVHPHNASEFNNITSSKFRHMLSNDNTNRIVAVGETGLDYNRMFSSKIDQINSFKRHIEIAIEFNKPLFLHSREAHKDFIDVLDQYSDRLPPVVVHCFTGKKSELEDYLSRGFYIGITGYIAIENRSKDLQRFVSMIPLNKLMIETDAPYMKPTGAPKTPTGNMEPYLLGMVADKLSKLYKVPVGVIISKTTQNSKKFFQLA